MSDRTAYVYVELDGKPVLVGTLYARFRKNRESATFTYDASWLSHPSRFALEPALVLQRSNSPSRSPSISESTTRRLAESRTK